MFKSQEIKQGAINMSKTMSRRKFLIGSAAVSVVACGGLGYLSLQAPAVQFTEARYPGATADSPKILVVYASRCGSTGGVADAIAQSFHEQGAAVDVKLTHEAHEVAGYDAVVVGAPIYMSKWMPEAKDFITTHRAELAHIHTAYFLTCMTLSRPASEDDRNKVVEQLEKVKTAIPEVSPVKLGFFAGKLDYDKLPPAMGVLYRVASGGDATPGDYRDFPAIRAWAAQLYPVLITV
jgi:menaquinone-dependent protoporphyrinogen oxidase